MKGRLGITLAEIAMSLIIVAIIIAILAATFSQVSEKRRYTAFMETLAYMHSKSAQLTTYSVASATEIMYLNTIYGGRIFLYNGNTTFDIITANIPKNLCTDLIERHTHPFKVNRILHGDQQGLPTSELSLVTDGSLCNDSYNTLQFVYDKA